MDDRHVEEHRAEITRQNRTTPMVVLVVVVCAIVAVLVSSSGGSDQDGAAPTTTSAPPTTVPENVSVAPEGGRPPIVGVARGGQRLFVFGSRHSDVMGGTVAPDLELVYGSPAVAVGDLLALLAPDGGVLVGREGQPFAPVACCFDDLLPSNEPGHVWAIDGTRRAVLVDLRAGPVGISLDLDGERPIGLGPFGLVTADDRQHATWRRPDFPPTRVDVPSGRDPLASGGDVVAFAAPAEVAIEIRRVDDGELVASLPVPANTRSLRVTLSVSGDAVALTTERSTVVYDLTDRRTIGRIVGPDQRPVAVGDRSFAAIVDGELVDSSTGLRRLAAEPFLIATRAE